MAKTLPFYLVTTLLLTACNGKNSGETNFAITNDSDIVISEFLAKNESGLTDEDSELSDWIEIVNSGTEPQSLNGWSLTDEDGVHRKWRFPDITLGSGEFIIIFASGKDRRPSDGSELHTNFKLGGSGEYLALFDAEGNTATELAPGYGPTTADQSIGLHEEPGYWDLKKPTPGAGNSEVSQATQPSMEFSRPSGLVLSGDPVSFFQRGGRSYCTTSEEEKPTTDSPPCQSEYSIDGVLTVQALLTDDAGNTLGNLSRTWISVDASEANLQRNLGVVVLETYGNHEVSEPWNDDFLTTELFVYEPNTSLTNASSYAGHSGAHVRGNSTAEYEKKQYAIELRDNDERDRKVSLLGMPEEADWVLHAPFSDKTLMRNHLMYAWSNSIGRYASRTRFVEVYIDHDGNGVKANDYEGVYVLIEKIEQGKNRVNIANLKQDDNATPEISGGYLLKKDWIEGGPRTFVETERYEDILLHVYPDAESISDQQKSWLEDYLNDFETSLSRKDGSYNEFINVDSFIDYQLLIELSRNVDGYVLSTYLHKDKEGLLSMGPVWDFNGSLGNADYFEAWEAEGWHFNNSEFPADNPTAFEWYEQLLKDQDYQQRLRDRWAELRQDKLATTRLHAHIDATAIELQSAAGRNFKRWDILGEYVWPNDFGSGDRTTYAEEIDYLKDWLEARAQWLDEELAN